MPAYHFVAISKESDTQHGVMDAESEKHVRQLLRDKTWVPVKVWEVHGKAHQLDAFSSDVPSHRQWRSLFSRARNLKAKGLNAKALAAITRQLATLLSAGLPLEEALFAVVEQTDQARIKGLILAVRNKVMQGHTLAHALSDYPAAFSTLYCKTISAGEKTGRLDEVLLRLADYTEQQAYLKQKLQTALIYPAMIVLVAVSIVGFLLEYVVPKMVAVYGHINQALPTLTTVLITISDGVRIYGMACLCLIVASVFAGGYALKKYPRLRFKVHTLLLKAPLIGYILRTVNTARFARTLSILSAAGLPILEGMQVAASVVTPPPIQQALIAAEHHIREGVSIHLALKRTRYFMPMTIHMIASGEASGQLENMLERVAQNQENDMTRLIEVALALFEPAIILIMGAVVLFIVLAVLLPIFDLNQFAG